MQRRQLIVFPLAAGVAACATPGSPDPAAPTGWVIGSITHESSVGRYGLAITGQPGQRVPSPSLGYGMWTPFNKEMDDELKERGGTYAQKLPAGEYRIVGWFVLRAQTDYRSARPVEIPFKVEAGKATYLGNLHFDPHWEAVVLRDRAERDLPVLRRRHAEVATTEVSQSIAPGTTIEQFGRGVVSRSEVPLFVGVPLRR
jgi:hypothetical protein